MADTKKISGLKKPAANKPVQPVKQFKSEPGMVNLRNTTMSNIVIMRGCLSKTILTPNQSSIIVPAMGSIMVDKEVFANLAKRKVIAGMLDKKYLVVDSKKDVEISETISDPTPPANLQPENVTGQEGEKTATVKQFQADSVQVKIS